LTLIFPTITVDAGYISYSDTMTPTMTSASNIITIITTTSIDKKKLYKRKATPGLQIKESLKQNKMPKTINKRQFYCNALGLSVPNTSRHVPSLSRLFFFS